MIFYEKKKYPEALENSRQFVGMDPSGERVISAKIMIDYCLTEAARSAEIRVLVLNNISEVLAKSPGKIECLDQTCHNQRYIADIPPGKPARFFTKGLYLRGSSLGEAGMKAILLVSRNNVINVNGNNYRGRIEIAVNGQKQLDVINTLDIESDIKGVVSREMGRKWAHEALKAQAVVSRTYALYQVEKNSREAFDICSTTNTQVIDQMRPFHYQKKRQRPSGLRVRGPGTELA